jgi:hypothetical protein
VSAACALPAIAVAFNLMGQSILIGFALVMIAAVCGRLATSFTRNWAPLDARHLHPWRNHRMGSCCLAGRLRSSACVSCVVGKRADDLSDKLANGDWPHVPEGMRPARKSGGGGPSKADGPVELVISHMTERVCNGFIPERLAHIPRTGRK